MDSKDAGDKKEFDGEMTLIDILSKSRLCHLYFRTSKVPEWVRDTLHLAWNYNYPSFLGVRASRAQTQRIMNKSVKEERVWASYLFAAGLYEAGCEHTKEEIEEGDIMGCECYKLISEQLGEDYEEVEFIGWPGGKRMMLVKG